MGTSRLRKAAIGIAIAVLVLTLGTVALGSQLSGSTTSVTGCLSQSGDLTKFAAGDTPLKPCTGTQVQVHLDGDDLVSIVAGTGLLAESTNGSVTLFLDPNYALPQSCEVNQVARWRGEAWVCSWDVMPLP